MDQGHQPRLDSDAKLIIFLESTNYFLKKM
jgi:hypothetical protein